MGARRKVANVAAILKAYEADARRAERAAKGAPDEATRDTWLTYAMRTRAHAATLAARGAEGPTSEADTIETTSGGDGFDHLPPAQAAWARHLAELDRLDAERYKARREGVKI